MRQLNLEEMEYIQAGQGISNRRAAGCLAATALWTAGTVALVLNPATTAIGLALWAGNTALVVTCPMGS